jgi:hypothetical protein
MTRNNVAKRRKKKSRVEVLKITKEKQKQKQSKDAKGEKAKAVNGSKRKEMEPLMESRPRLQGCYQTAYSRPKFKNAI